MTAQKCAQLIVEAAASRRRKVTASTRGRLVPSIKLLAPRSCRQIAKKIVPTRLLHDYVQEDNNIKHYLVIDLPLPVRREQQ